MAFDAFVPTLLVYRQRGVLPEEKGNKAGGGGGGGLFLCIFTYIIQRMIETCICDSVTAIFNCIGIASLHCVIGQEN